MIRRFRLRRGAAGKASGEVVRVLGLTLGVAERTGRTVGGKLGLMILTTWVFLGVPDLDFALLPILHHRSIVTHSILPPLLFLLVARRFGAAPIAGAMIGTSVHLSCDMLSPMEGFAQIWLPAPIKAPLGPLSYLWLAGNALVGYATAFVIARISLPKRVGFPFVTALSGVTGAAYGALNEQSFLSVVVCLVFPVTAGTVAWWKARRAQVGAKTVL